jgi:hypothetical protein
MSEYNKSLQEWNNNREYEKELNIKSIKSIIANSWTPDFKIINSINKEKSHFEKIVKILENMWIISWKEDLANKIKELKNSKKENENIAKYSLDEIGIAIPEYINDNNKVVKLKSIHKQTISRILEKNNK